MDADTILFGTVNSGIQRVPASGGDSEPVTSLEEGEQAHRWPTLLTDDEAVLFTSIPTSVESEPWIVMKRLDSGERHRLAPDFYYAYIHPMLRTHDDAIVFSS